MLFSLLRRIYRYVRPIVIKGINNEICLKTKQRKSFIIRVFGNNNKILIGENCRLQNCSLTLTGDNNTVIFDDVTKIDGPAYFTLSGNGFLSIGRNTGIRGVDCFIKDGFVKIGKNCMFAYDIKIRNNDYHQVLDNESGSIINKPHNITIGNHVWVCQNSSIIKTVEIGDDSIIAFGAVVTKGCPSNSIIAGNPAKIVKSNINWTNNPLPSSANISL